MNNNNNNKSYKILFLMKYIYTYLWTYVWLYEKKKSNHINLIKENDVQKANELFQFFILKLY